MTSVARRDRDPVTPLLATVPQLGLGILLSERQIRFVATRVEKETKDH